MASPVSLSRLHGEFNTMITFPINLDTIITATTTPEEFDIERAKCPTYKLINVRGMGFTALHIAAQVGNVLLIEHIVRVGGAILLDVVNCEGKTPLFCAVEYNQRAAVIKLIALGSKVNAACMKTFLRTHINFPYS